MTDLVTRVLERDDEIRAAHTLFRAALHTAAATDGEWPEVRAAYQPGRTHGVFDADTLIGTARSMDSDLTVPGGSTVPLSAVTGVGVRADRTRRGVLTELMRTQLTDFASRGVTAATLHATEGGIYGRFGYGVATVGRSYTVNRLRARLRPEVPSGGEVELLDLDTALDRLPGLYAALERRPGMMTRPVPWWNHHSTWLRKSEQPVVTVIHHGAAGVDGFVLYRVARESGSAGVLNVVDLHTSTADAFAGLWRFLLGVDLVDEIHTVGRPLDEPVELLLADPRAVTVTAVRDETWLRLVDVPAALAARELEGDPLVVEVVDPVLEGNSGRWLVGNGRVRRTDEPAGLRLGVDALAMVFLGSWRPSALVHAGRAHVNDPGVAARADRLFGTGRSAWCGTFF